MTLLQAVLKIRSYRVLGYAIAITLSFAALWVRLEMASVFEGYPFVTFFVAVLFSALLGGLGPGLVAAIVSGILAQFFLIQPIYSLEILNVSGWVGLAFYGFTVASIVALVHGMAVAYQSQMKAQQDLAELNQTLEQRVLERTEQLRVEAAEREALDGQLRQVQKMEAVGQLTGGIAHDFNNMLAIVTGSLELAKIRAEAQEDERITKYIGLAQEGVDRAASLTGRLMAFSRQQALAPQAVDVGKLVTGTHDLLQRTLGDHIFVDTVLSERLWHCFADPIQLENAILNLSINARDAMPDGGRLTFETRNCEVGADSDDALSPGQYVLLAVSDTGTGMPPDVVSRAFDPFFTTKGVGKGTGLGLSQVYGYAKQSGGTVRIKSEVGRGTTIEVLLPRFSGQSFVLEPLTNDQVLPMGSPAIVVLLVEDEDRVRQVASDALSELGYNVIAVECPLRALEHIRQSDTISLLLTDVQMPNMSGRVLADRAKELRPGLPVLYMSGFNSEADDTWIPGASLLPKPFTIGQLAQAVDQSLRHSVLL